jgi:hypothetical protein
VSIGETLRNPIWVRFADPDKEPVENWCEYNSLRNAFDKAVLGYPSTKVLAAHNNGKVYAYMPVQGTAMLESIGPNPDTTPLEQASAIVELVKSAATLAHGAGYREIYYLSSDDITDEGAAKLGFQLLPYRVLRKRL